MESWNLVIVGSGPAALRAAIAAADAGSTPLLLESSGIGSGTSGADIAGLAAVSYTHLTLPTIYPV